MIAKKLKILSEVKYLEKEKYRFEDERGYFSVPFNKDELESNGVKENWIQDNISFSYKGTIRGLHFEDGMAKLVQCIQGSIIDVIVDARENSLTYLEYEYVNLKATQGNIVYIPDGFAHGFLALEDSLVFYKQNKNYNAKNERQFNPFEPKIEVKWENWIHKDKFIVSKRDKEAKLL